MTKTSKKPENTTESSPSDETTQRKQMLGRLREKYKRHNIPPKGEIDKMQSKEAAKKLQAVRNIKAVLQGYNNPAGDLSDGDLRRLMRSQPEIFQQLAKQMQDMQGALTEMHAVVENTAEENAEEENEAGAAAVAPSPECEVASENASAGVPPENV